MNRTRPGGIGEAVVVEGDDRALGAGLDLLDAGVAAQPLDGDDLQQIVDLGRQLAEAVDQLGREGVDLAPVDQRRDAAIEAEPHIEIGDIGFGDQHRRADGDLRRPLLRRLAERADAAPRAGDRLLEEMLVELDADLADMARLLLAEQIAGAADVEIVARQREAGAELVERLHHFEPALRRLGQHLAGRAASDRHRPAPCRGRCGRAADRAAPARTCRRDGR